MGCVLLLRACAHRCMIRDALNTLASLINRIIRISLNERAIGPIEKMSGIIIIITSFYLFRKILRKLFKCIAIRCEGLQTK